MEAEVRDRGLNFKFIIFRGPMGAALVPRVLYNLVKQALITRYTRNEGMRY